jgi:hypothetical protein
MDVSPSPAHGPDHDEHLVELNAAVYGRENQFGNARMQRREEHGPFREGVLWRPGHPLQSINQIIADPIG